jgi:hypothetical protein|tara:strand:+ start:4246 stop:4419 length:174 start_codon:yes stop_codon:yes gene_type:complete
MKKIIRIIRSIGKLLIIGLKLNFIQSPTSAIIKINPTKKEGRKGIDILTICESVIPF